MCGFRLRGATERAPESPAVWITAADSGAQTCHAW